MMPDEELRKIYEAICRALNSEEELNVADYCDLLREVALLYQMRRALVGPY